MANLAEGLIRARKRIGISQGELARRTGISRQALGAIESGLYNPSVAVALGLARELGETVEGLFGGAKEPRVSATWIGDDAHHAPAPGARVALGRVGGRLIATPQPLSAITLAPAAGLVGEAAGRRVSVAAFRSRDEIDSTLLLAGCDPGAAILADWLMRRRSPVNLVTIGCSSRAALRALAQGRVHVAGVHLRDPKSGEYNVASTRKLLGNHRAALVNFASWEIGLCVRRGPGAIGDLADLGRKGVRIVNREAGSGARHALDDVLARVGIDPADVSGYERELGGHLEVAAAVGMGDADAGVTIRIAAEAYGLDFVPIREERYDLVIPESEMEWGPVRVMLDALNSSGFSRELSELCAYDTRRTGSTVFARKG